MRRLLLAIFALFSMLTSAQNLSSKHHFYVSIPDSALTTVSSFANYLSIQFPDDFDRVKVIYYWIGRNITYDVENMYNIDYQENPEKLIDQTFETRKSICQGYAELFNALCTESGITCHVIHGFTRQHDQVQESGHAWNMVQLGPDYYGIDPTWAAGYVTDGVFTRYFSWDYFLVSPQEFVASHMPFDPVWQCLAHPITVSSFYRGKNFEPLYSEEINFTDSIHQMLHMPLMDQYQTILQRVEQLDYTNSVTNDFVLYLKQNLENDHLQKVNAYRGKMVAQFNRSSSRFSTAVQMYNNYISYFNKQFQPTRPDEEIRQLMEECEEQLHQAQQELQQVDGYDGEMEKNIQRLKQQMAELHRNINNQKLFITTYLATPKNYRAGLFRK